MAGRRKRSQPGQGEIAPRLESQGAPQRFLRPRVIAGIPGLSSTLLVSEAEERQPLRVAPIGRHPPLELGDVGGSVPGRREAAHEALGRRRICMRHGALGAWSAEYTAEEGGGGRY